MSNGSELQPLLPYYVYVLIDPRDDHVFYVGKGQNERAFDHVAEVRHKIAKGESLTSRKQLTIESILTEGHDKGPKAIVVARFADEDQAFAVESVLINFVYGYGSRLTNESRGHGAEFVRPAGELGKLPGLDIPARERVYDGGYRDANVEALRISGATGLIDTISAALIQRGFSPRGFKAGTPDRPFDPGASNGWLGLLVNIEGIDFLVSVSVSCRVRVAIANTMASRSESSQLGLERLERALGVHFRIGPPKNIPVAGQGRYRDFGLLLDDGEHSARKPTFDSEQVSELYALLERFRSILSVP